MVRKEIMIEAIKGYFKEANLEITLRNIISYCESRLDDLYKEEEKESKWY